MGPGMGGEPMKLAKKHLFLPLFAVISAGCGSQPEIDAPDPSVQDELLEFSPVSGQELHGSINARVPLHGVTFVPGDMVVAHVWHRTDREWVEIARGRTQEVSMEGREPTLGKQLFAFDLGEACLSGCDNVIPLHAWGGFGPFTATFLYYSEGQGALVRPGIGMGEMSDDVDPIIQANIDVVAMPVDAHHE